MAHKKRRGRSALRRRYGRALGPEFETMAREQVGDGKDPNRFFVTMAAGHHTHGTGIVGILESKRAAVAAAKALTRATPSQPILVEDRKSGEVWGNAAYEEMQAVQDDEEN